MTNYEKYKDEILKLNNNGMDICDATLKMRRGKCTNRNCAMCLLNSMDWLFEEYKEPEIDWSKVPRGTMVEVSNSDACSWYKKHFYGYDPSLLYPFIVIASDSSVVACFKNCRLAEVEE